MNYVVGDIGNTLTKISLFGKNLKIVRSYNIETDKVIKLKYQKKFFNKIFNKKINKKILFSSVVPNAYKSIKLHLKKKNIITYEIKDLKLENIITLNIKKINELGSDRIANAIAAYDKYKKIV